MADFDDYEGSANRVSRRAAGQDARQQIQEGSREFLAANGRIQEFRPAYDAARRELAEATIAFDRADPDDRKAEEGELHAAQDRMRDIQAQMDQMQAAQQAARALIGDARKAERQSRGLLRRAASGLSSHVLARKGGGHMEDHLRAMDHSPYRSSMARALGAAAEHSGHGVLFHSVFGRGSEAAQDRMTTLRGSPFAKPSDKFDLFVKKGIAESARRAAGAEKTEQKRLKDEEAFRKRIQRSEEFRRKQEQRAAEAAQKKTDKDAETARKKAEKEEEVGRKKAEREAESARKRAEAAAAAQAKRDEKAQMRAGIHPSQNLKAIPAQQAATGAEPHAPAALVPAAEAPAEETPQPMPRSPPRTLGYGASTGGAGVLRAIEALTAAIQESAEADAKRHQELVSTLEWGLSKPVASAQASPPPAAPSSAPNPTIPEPAAPAEAALPAAAPVVSLTLPSPDKKGSGAPVAEDAPARRRRGAGTSAKALPTAPLPPSAALAENGEPVAAPALQGFPVAAQIERDAGVGSGASRDADAPEPVKAKPARGPSGRFAAKEANEEFPPTKRGNAAAEPDREAPELSLFSPGDLADIQRPTEPSRTRTTRKAVAGEASDAGHALAPEKPVRGANGRFAPKSASASVSRRGVVSEEVLGGPAPVPASAAAPGAQLDAAPPALPVEPVSPAVPGVPAKAKAPSRAAPPALSVQTLGEMPKPNYSVAKPAARSSSQVRREDGVGAIEAIHRSAAEKRARSVVVAQAAAAAAKALPAALPTPAKAARQTPSASPAALPDPVRGELEAGEAAPSLPTKPEPARRGTIARTRQLALDLEPAAPSTQPAVMRAAKADRAGLRADPVKAAETIVGNAEAGVRARIRSQPPSASAQGSEGGDKKPSSLSAGPSQYVPLVADSNGGGDLPASNGVAVAVQGMHAVLAELRAMHMDWKKAADADVAWRERQDDIEAKRHEEFLNALAEKQAEANTPHGAGKDGSGPGKGAGKGGEGPSLVGDLLRRAEGAAAAAAGGGAIKAFRKARAAIRGNGATEVPAAAGAAAEEGVAGAAARAPGKAAKAGGKLAGIVGRIARLGLGRGAVGALLTIAGIIGFGEVSKLIDLMGEKDEGNGGGAGEGTSPAASAGASPPRLPVPAPPRAPVPQTPSTMEPASAVPQAETAPAHSPAESVPAAQAEGTPTRPATPASAPPAEVPAGAAQASTPASASEPGLAPTSPGSTPRAETPRAAVPEVPNAAASPAPAAATGTASPRPAAQASTPASASEPSPSSAASPETASPRPAASVPTASAPPAPGTSPSPLGSAPNSGTPRFSAAMPGTQPHSGPSPWQTGPRPDQISPEGTAETRRAAADPVVSRTRKGTPIQKSDKEAGKKGFGRWLGKAFGPAVSGTIAGYSCYTELEELYGRYAQRKISQQDYRNEFVEIVTRNVSAAAGMWIGEKLGLAIAAHTGPLAPVAGLVLPLVGGAVGGMVGGEVGSQLGQTGAVRSIVGPLGDWSAPTQEPTGPTQSFTDFDRHQPAAAPSETPPASTPASNPPAPPPATSSPDASPVPAEATPPSPASPAPPSASSPAPEGAEPVPHPAASDADRVAAQGGHNISAHIDPMRPLAASPDVAPGAMPAAQLVQPTLDPTRPAQMPDRRTPAPANNPEAHIQPIVLATQAAQRSAAAAPPAPGTPASPQAPAPATPVPGRDGTLPTASAGAQEAVGNAQRAFDAEHGAGAWQRATPEEQGNAVRQHIADIGRQAVASEGRPQVAAPSPTLAPAPSVQASPLPAPPPIAPQSAPAASSHPPDGVPGTPPAAPANTQTAIGDTQRAFDAEHGLGAWQRATPEEQGTAVQQRIADIGRQALASEGQPQAAPPPPAPLPVPAAAPAGTVPPVSGDAEARARQTYEQQAREAANRPMPQGSFSLTRRPGADGGALAPWESLPENARRQMIAGQEHAAAVEQEKARKAAAAGAPAAHPGQPAQPAQPPVAASGAEAAPLPASAPASTPGAAAAQEQARQSYEQSRTEAAQRPMPQGTFTLTRRPGTDGGSLVPWEQVPERQRAEMVAGQAHANAVQQEKDRKAAAAQAAARPEPARAPETGAPQPAVPSFGAQAAAPEGHAPEVAPGAAPAAALPPEGNPNPPSPAPTPPTVVTPGAAVPEVPGAAAPPAAPSSPEPDAPRFALPVPPPQMPESAPSAPAPPVLSAGQTDPGAESAPVPAAPPPSAPVPASGSAPEPAMAPIPAQGAPQQPTDGLAGARQRYEAEHGPNSWNSAPPEARQGAVTASLNDLAQRELAGAQPNDQTSGQTDVPANPTEPFPSNPAEAGQTQAGAAPQAAQDAHTTPIVLAQRPPAEPQLHAPLAGPLPSPSQAPQGSQQDMEAMVAGIRRRMEEYGRTNPAPSHPGTAGLRQPSIPAVVSPGPAVPARPDAPMTANPAGAGQAQPNVPASGGAASNAGALPAKGGFAARAPGVMDRLQQDFGLTPAQAAGVVGNLGHESGLEAINERNPTVAGSRGGFGWAQWTGPRRVAFEKFAKEQNLDPKSDEANYGFLKQELQTTHAHALRAVRATNDTKAATHEFERTYEGAGVKHYESREAKAQQALKAQNQAHAERDRAAQSQQAAAQPAGPAQPAEGSSETARPTQAADATPQPAMSDADRVAAQGGHNISERMPDFSLPRSSARQISNSAPVDAPDAARDAPAAPGSADAPLPGSRISGEQVARADSGTASDVLDPGASGITSRNVPAPDGRDPAASPASRDDLAALVGGMNDAHAALERPPAVPEAASPAPPPSVQPAAPRAVPVPRAPNPVPMAVGGAAPSSSLASGVQGIAALTQRLAGSPIRYSGASVLQKVAGAMGRGAPSVPQALQGLLHGLPGISTPNLAIPGIPTSIPGIPASIPRIPGIPSAAAGLLSPSGPAATLAGFFTGSSMGVSGPSVPAGPPGLAAPPGAVPAGAGAVQTPLLPSGQPQGLAMAPQPIRPTAASADPVPEITDTQRARDSASHDAKNQAAAQGGGDMPSFGGGGGGGGSSGATGASNDGKSGGGVNTPPIKSDELSATILALNAGFFT